MTTVRASNCHPVECEDIKPAPGPLNSPTSETGALQHQSCDDYAFTCRALSSTPAEFGCSASPDDCPETGERATDTVSKPITARHSQCTTELRRGAALKQIVAELNDETSIIGVGATLPAIPSFRMARSMVRVPIDPISH